LSGGTLSILSIPRRSPPRHEADQSMQWLIAVLTLTRNTALACRQE
jgi:hypothetical protein